MNKIIDDFDKLRKHIKTDDGKKLAIEFRKLLIRSNKYSNKLDKYFTDTLDGIEPEIAKKLNGL